MATERTPLIPNFSPKGKASPWYAIGMVFVIGACSTAIYAPLIQFYTQIFCNRYFREQRPGEIIDNIPLDMCVIPEVQAIVSRVQATIMFLTSGATLLLAGFYGGLSDRKGRRIVFMCGSFGNCILLLGYLATYYYEEYIGVFLLYLAPTIATCLGTETIFFAAAQAYLSDCTTPTKRTIVLSRLYSAGMLGATIAPTLSSVVLKATNNLVLIFYIVLLTHVCFFLSITFLLPESRTIAADQDVHDESIFKQIKVFSAVHIFYRTKSRYLGRFAPLLIACTQLLLQVYVMPQVILYAMLQFGWTAYENGLYVSALSLSRFPLMVVLLPLLSKKFNPTSKAEETEASSSTVVENPEDMIRSARFDVWMIRIGAVVECVCFVTSALAVTSSQYAASGIIQGLAILSQPSMRSLLSSLVDPSEIGELMGALAILESFAAIVSQISMSAIYSATVATMPNAVFLACAVVSGTGCTLSFLLGFKKNIALEQV